MRISKLQQRITVQRRSATLDAYGQEINSWINIGTVWAEVKPLSGREKLRNSSMVVESQLTHQVTVRYSELFVPPTIADAWRILFGTRIFNITASMNVDEGDKTIIFDCTEGSLDGQ
jgi:SPP1 family predicted phage head-tail adaptor